MASKQKKSCSTSLFNRKMYIKTVRYYYKPSNVPKVKGWGKLAMLCVGEDFHGLLVRE